MLGADCDRLAEAEAKSLEDAAFAGASLSLVGYDDHRRILDPQPSGDFLVDRGEAIAGVDHEQRRVRFPYRSLGLRPHPAGKRLRILVLEARRVDHSKIEADQLRLTLAAVARDPGPVVDKRQAPADQPVEQGRFADVRAADDGDGRDGHRAAIAAPLPSGKPSVGRSRRRCRASNWRPRA